MFGINHLRQYRCAAKKLPFSKETSRKKDGMPLIPCIRQYIYCAPKVCPKNMFHPPPSPSRTIKTSRQQTKSAGRRQNYRKYMSRRIHTECRTRPSPTRAGESAVGGRPHATTGRASRPDALPHGPVDAERGRRPRVDRGGGPQEGPVLKYSFNIRSKDI